MKTKQSFPWQVEDASGNTIALFQFKNNAGLFADAMIQAFQERGKEVMYYVRSNPIEEIE